MKARVLMLDSLQAQLWQDLSTETVLIKPLETLEHVLLMVPSFSLASY
jgi:hypothetical protein